MRRGCPPPPHPPRSGWGAGGPAFPCSQSRGGGAGRARDAAEPPRAPQPTTFSLALSCTGVPLFQNQAWLFTLVNGVAAMLLESQGELGSGVPNRPNRRKRHWPVGGVGPSNSVPVWDP